MSFDGPELSIEEVETRTEVDESQAEGAVRKKFSTFFVTINTNYRPKTTAESLSMGASLRRVVNEMLNTTEGLRAVLWDNWPDGTAGFDSIEEASTRFSIELGKDPRGRRVHTHAQVDMTHNTKVQFDKTKIKEFVLSRINDDRVKNVFIGVRGARNLDKTRLQYISKDSRAAAGVRSSETSEQPATET